MQEITKTKNQRPKTDRLMWIFLAMAAVTLYFSGLSIPLVGPDEPRYAQVAREMFEHGDWVTPTLGGANWFEKPALLYWLQIIGYKIFGVSEFSARFGSAVFGLLTVFSLWILGRSLAAEGTKKNGEIKNKKTFSENSISFTKNDFANWLALIAASSIGLIVFSRGASFDIILTFPLTASLVAFFIFDQSKNKSLTTYHLPLTTFYFFIGISLLAKGLVGIVFPLAIVAFYYVLSFKLPSRTFIVSLVWGTILSLLVASIWYVPMYLAHGFTFIDEFFIQHHFARYTSNKYSHPQPFYFFLWVLPLMTLPWLPFFLASIWNFVTVQSSKFKVQSQFLVSLFSSSSPLFLFSLCWIIVPLIFFSFSGSKLPGYILPALPAALILIAIYVWHFVQKSYKRKLLVQISALAMFALVWLTLHFFIASHTNSDTVKHLMKTADSQGFTGEKVLNLHTISHNAEFYAAGRLIREADGKLKKFPGVHEVLEEIKNQKGENVLVLVPLEYLKELTSSDLVSVQVLSDNGELAIVLVNAKN
ncbi:MAG: glycosyltransferase family 39 protein [Acidobacteriota bacterium]|jgi:4-amino-4-deoxy-L-arabinose transferase-like glycosyltransferase|nr:glycosyltransferase family 39 protein [Acidobacteriota bacterium]